MLRIIYLALIFFAIQINAEQERVGNFDLYKARDKSEAIEEDQEEILQRLYPFYFAYGKGEVKLQVSFKTPIVKTWPLYLGYTQQMFYVFGEHTKSFRDLTYNPELIYSMRDLKLGALKSIDFGGFSHSSNGKPNPDHRSYDKSYVRFNFEEQSAHWLTRLSVQLQDLYFLENNNLDIQDYIGPLMINLSFIQLFEGWIDKTEVSLQACPGGKFANYWDKGGYQLSVSFRLGGIKLVPAFYLQYYEGFAETLLNYNSRVDDFRAGLIF